MPPGRDNAAGLQVDDLVGQGDRGVAVGHHHDCGVAGKGPQPRQNCGLDMRVDTGGRVVEDQQPRLPDQRPREGNPLPLPSRQGRPPLAKTGIERAGKGPDELLGQRGPQGRPHLPVVVVRPQGHVAPHRVVEQECLLRNERDCASDPLVVEQADIDTIEEHPPRGGVDEPDEQGRQRRFPGARRPDDGDGAARRYLERHVTNRGGRPTDRVGIGIRETIEVDANRGCGDTRESRGVGIGRWRLPATRLGLQPSRAVLHRTGRGQHRLHPVIAHDRPR